MEWKKKNEVKEVVENWFYCHTQLTHMKLSHITIILYHVLLSFINLKFNLFIIGIDN